MAKLLIIYYTRTKNTEKLAEEIAEGVRMSGAEAVVKKVQEADPEEILDYDGVVMGSPVYYGTMREE